MEQIIINIQNQALEKISQSKTTDELNGLRVKYLGRKSEFNRILKGIKDLPEEERKKIGSLANSVKREIEKALKKKEEDSRAKKIDAETERVDVTIPGEKVRRGYLHPLTLIQNEIEDIFTSLGFEIADGPEVETEWYNFDALNMPKDHPARDTQDTFWLRQNKNQNGKRMLLRTQTSNVQVRYMEKHKPPFRVISPGKIFRNEASDASHEHTFHQFEALMVGDDINVGNFKYIGEQFFSRFFKKEIKVRLRPSFFPFTEPSFEFDISCAVCGGQGCKTCQNAGWLEIGGAGMVNQEVFVNSGYSRGKYNGFAWGFGLERLAMMKYKIDDIRLFHSGDLRFINQF